MRKEVQLSGSSLSKLNQKFLTLRKTYSLSEILHLHLSYTHLPELGKSMPSRMLSCLLFRVETTIRYLTLTVLTDSNCTAYMTA